MCRGSRGLAHYFATSLIDARIVRPHFELSQCDNRSGFRIGPSCLRKELVGLGYRLPRSYYTACDE